MGFTEIQDIIKCLSKVHKLFDIIRIIDPVKKQVIHYDDMGNTSPASTCHDFWNRGELCQNCVSVRAMNENDTFMKLEYNNGKVFMIMASPIQHENGTYIIEMLKDITDTGIITDIASSNLKETKDIIVELNKKIITDELTDVYNRRYINERLPVDLYEATCEYTPLSVMMVDIDCFKEVNDTYGHTVGDAVLIELCKTMKANIRKDQDWIARYGGEEFLIVLKETTQEIAYKISEKIRISLENQAIQYKDHKIQITVSSGTYTVEPGRKNAHEALCAVDENLYTAKNKGKNRTISS